MSLDATRTVKEFAAEVPNATRTFEKLGIDYCCGGSKSLSDACSHAHLSVDDVLRALEQDSGFRQAPEAGLPDFAVGSLGDLIVHILTTHHVYVKQELPRLHQLLHKVVAVHGKNHPELGQIQQTFQGMSAELISHMMKEEHILFPYIAALEKAANAGKPAPNPMFGSVSNPVHMMELEHDSAGAALKAICSLSANYTAPDDACFSYRTLYTALKEFETDLHQHVHLENNILFPRAIKLENDGL
ncbi:MAG TPA: iron-sulfur cluster repair di-iron protein [Candidatus Angelobacter sp.]|nr:iron-sulfur cluster repair di-iron protein [Candidatus Angelobacter sp.]